MRQQDRQGKELQSDTKIGFEHIKMLFENLFYKVRVPGKRSEA